MSGYLFGKDKSDAEIYRVLAARKTARKRFSVYRGVSKSGNPKNPFRCGLTFKGRKYYLGQYETELEAAKAYNEAALKIIGPLALLNDLP